MRRVLQYIIGEVKEGRLAKSSAVELTREISAQIVPAEPPVLHPLLHRNTSDLSALRFTLVQASLSALTSGLLAVPLSHQVLPRGNMKPLNCATGIKAVLRARVF